MPERIPECGHPDKKHAARGLCKPCWTREYNARNAERVRAVREEWVEKNRDRERAKYKRYREKNPEKVREAFQKWREKTPQYFRDRHLFKKYGLTIADFLKLIEEQNGVCAICQEAPATAVDHNHETGQVRGILCSQCNSLIGYAREQEAVLFAAVTYLREKGANPEPLKVKDHA